MIFIKMFLFLTSRKIYPRPDHAKPPVIPEILRSMSCSRMALTIWGVKSGAASRSVIDVTVCKVVSLGTPLVRRTAPRSTLVYVKSRFIYNQKLFNTSVILPICETMTVRLPRYAVVNALKPPHSTLHTCKKIGSRALTPPASASSCCPGTAAPACSAGCPSRTPSRWRTTGSGREDPSPRARAWRQRRSAR